MKQQMNRITHKHPRLPAGFGSIRYLGSGRSNPFAVFPTSHGNYGKKLRAICYVPDWYIGVAVLAAWNAGQFDPGLPERLKCGMTLQGIRQINEELVGPMDVYCRQLLSCFHTFIPKGSMLCSLQEGFDHFYAWKYDVSAPLRLSDTSASHDMRAFRWFSSLAARPMDSITVDELQQIVDHIGLRRSSVDRAVTLIKGIYRYALSRELCTRNPAQYVRMPAVPESVSRQDFSDDELRILWEHKEDPLVRMILIMCYSGFRWSAYLTMETNLEEGYFRGGVKTKAGKNRIVPIHSAISPLVEAVLKDGGYHCGLNQWAFIRAMHAKMSELGIDAGERHHTPHSCRHTFSRLCESFGVRESDRRRMLGHSFGNDITNGVYGHRTLEELRKEIEKIKA